MVDTASKSSKEALKGTVKVTTFGRTRKAADTKVVVGDQLIREDEFSGYYFKKGSQAGQLVQPPYNPSTLMNLVTRNNVLAQCINTMEVNIDGTGFTIEATDSTNANATAKSPEKEFLQNFFNEPWVGTSFTTIRRQLRYDAEGCGNAYLEIIRNLEKKIVFARYIDATLMRLVKLDDPIPVETKVVRGTEEFTATVSVRERRFATKVGATLQYYKEFGASREVNKKTGEWVTDGTPPEMFGSEIIHFTVEKDSKTAYGIPRWINQLPSVVGSRKSEEFNLEFFDAGGVPPAAIFIQGGTLASDVKQQLDGYFGGGAKGKQRVAVVEVQSSSGSLDSAGSVQVKTERFGDVRANDSMFQGYDKNCEDHVRTGFRLPPLFLGKSADYNFATAMTAYMVTEAQVFAPERQEFDEIINAKIVASFDIRDFKFKSSPMTLKNVDVQLKGLEVIKDKVKPEQLVETINELTGLNFEYDGTTDALNLQLKQLALTQPVQQTGTGTQPLGSKAKDGKSPPLQPKAVKKADDLAKMNWLVNDWLISTGMINGDLAGQTSAKIIDEVTTLKEEDRKLFNALLALKMFDIDDQDLVTLTGCCADVITGEAHAH